MKINLTNAIQIKPLLKMKSDINVLNYQSSLSVAFVTQSSQNNYISNSKYISNGGGAAGES